MDHNRALQGFSTWCQSVYFPSKPFSHDLTIQILSVTKAYLQISNNLRIVTLMQQTFKQRTPKSENDNFGKDVAVPSSLQNFAIHCV